MGSVPRGYTSCEDCGGSGKTVNGTRCTHCAGTGIVAVYEPSYAENHEKWVPEQRQFLGYLTNLPLTVNLPERNFEGL